MKAEALLVAAFQNSVNRCLRLDPELEEGVAELDGTVVEIHVTGLERRFQLRPGRMGIVIAPVADDERQTTPNADVIISGAPFTLARYLVSLESTQGVLPDGVTVSGELALIQRLRDLLRRAELDWEEPLSNLVGDSLAHEIGRAARGVLGWAREAGDTLLRDVGEYMREERRVAPTALEMGDFCDLVDGLRDDVERLEKRVARLSDRAGAVER